MRSIALLARPTAAPLASRIRPRLRPARRAGVHGARVAVAAKDDLSESAVKDVKSTKELQDLIAATKGGGKLAVLEVRRVKASPAMEAFAPKYAAMAEDFADRATFATLLLDASEATRLAATSLHVEEVPEFFIWKDGEMQTELASGVSYEGLRHAVARSLGVVEDVG